MDSACPRRRRGEWSCAAGWPSTHADRPGAGATRPGPSRIGAPVRHRADPLTQLLIDEELRRAGVSRPVTHRHRLGRATSSGGTEAQRERWLWPLLAGEDFWCQLFSEPEAGSDLAGLRTTAVRDGEEWVISGRSLDEYATSPALGSSGPHRPGGAKAQGHLVLSARVDARGSKVRPLIDMTGTTRSTVFFDEVRIPADHCIGGRTRVGAGQGDARNERVSLSGEGDSGRGRRPTTCRARPPGRGCTEPRRPGPTRLAVHRAELLRCCAFGCLGHRGRQVARGRGIGAQASPTTTAST